MLLDASLAWCVIIAHGRLRAQCSASCLADLIFETVLQHAAKHSSLIRIQKVNVVCTLAQVKLTYDASGNG